MRFPAGNVKFAHSFWKVEKHRKSGDRSQVGGRCAVSADFSSAGKKSGTARRPSLQGIVHAIGFWTHSGTVANSGAVGALGLQFADASGVGRTAHSSPANPAGIALLEKKFARINTETQNFYARPASNHR
jgi:hypothetical protein